MKTLIINGSPRINGGTSSIVSKLKEFLNGEVTVLDTYKCEVSPCLDCRYCWTHSKCAIDDQMHEVYRQINEADNIVIASPIYFAELTGSLLCWASRLQYFWTSKNLRNEIVLEGKLRYGATILVDGGNGYMDTAFAMGKRLLRNMGAEFKELIYFSGTDKTEPTNPLNNITIMESINKLYLQNNLEMIYLIFHLLTVE
jgi:multimeric flavodoxin WrbA